jgi:hypothetical protein
MTPITAVTMSGNLTGDPKIRHSREGQSSTHPVQSRQQPVAEPRDQGRSRCSRCFQPDHRLQGLRLRPSGAAQLGDRLGRDNASSRSWPSGFQHPALLARGRATDSCCPNPAPPMKDLP